MQKQGWTKNGIRVIVVFDLVPEAGHAQENDSRQGALATAAHHQSLPGATSRPADGQSAASVRGSKCGERPGIEMICLWPAKAASSFFFRPGCPRNPLIRPDSRKQGEAKERSRGGLFGFNLRSAAEGIRVLNRAGRQGILAGLASTLSSPARRGRGTARGAVEGSAPLSCSGVTQRQLLAPTALKSFAPRRTVAVAETAASHAE